MENDRLDRRRVGTDLAAGGCPWRGIHAASERILIMETTLIEKQVDSGVASFNQRVDEHLGRPVHALTLDTIQVNLGLRCNLACRHCHVESSPARTERMEWETMKQVLVAAARCGAHRLDLTGGAPEMNPHFERFVTAARKQGLEVIVRTNLTILLDEGYRHLPDFYAHQRVHLIASLPCYLEENVNRQRGSHVYEKSVETIRRLNALGYGTAPDLALDLVYNPIGPVLPPAEKGLESDYRRELGARFDIRFTRLLTLTNMPVGRFWLELHQKKQEAAYHELLEQAFNSATLAGLMCRHQISVRWDGTLHDCDFNLAMRIPLTKGAPAHIRDFDVEALRTRQIAVGKHCFGCTAGCGSSCGGTLVKAGSHNVAAKEPVHER
jgi:radical SAM/Cys-rich protein